MIEQQSDIPTTFSVKCNYYYKNVPKTQCVLDCNLNI